MPVARLSGVQLHYEIDGDSGAPPLVLSNSLGCSLEMWAPQMPMLASRFRVIRYDSRGHGRSEVAPGPYSIEQLARDALGLLDELGMARTRLCGLSMGGMVGMWIGIHAPERLDRLVLANTAPKIGSAEMWNARIDAVRKGGMASIASALLSRWFTAGFLEVPTPIVGELRAAFERTPAAGYIACCAAVRDMDQRQSLGRIHVPTLVIAGTHDTVTPPHDGRYIAEHVPNARYVELPAAHLSNVQAAPAFTQTLLQFLTNRMEQTSNGRA